MPSERGKVENGALTDVLGIGVDAVSLDDAVRRIEGWIEGRDRRYVCLCNVHTVMQARRRADVRQALRDADMVTPDGMPLVWLSHMAGHRHTTRVYGPDLLLACMERSAARGHRHYFHGGAPGVSERLAATMGERFPGARIVGNSGAAYGTVEELCSEEAIAAIDGSGADVVWIGLGSPKQDLWMWRMRSRLRAPVLVGVGAAFDFETGRVRQAPVWMQRAGLEWGFRLSQEPGRLWRRYLVDNPWFVYELLCQKLRLKTYGP